MSGRIRIVDDEHAILLTDDDLRQFNSAVSASDKQSVIKEYTAEEAIDFLTENIHIYYRGKMWGFDDTEVREEICGELEK